jgi:sugar phosphate permease
VAILAITETVSWGVLYYAFAVILPSMEQGLGWTRAELTGAFSVALLTYAIALIPLGRWLDTHSARVVMTLGAVVGALLVLAWSRVEQLLFFTRSG